MLDDRLLNFLLAVGLVGLVVVLVLKSDRATRTCEDLREQLQEDLADDREQLQKDLTALLDSRLKPITDGVGVLRSKVGALDSRVSALDSQVRALGSRLGLLGTRITALKDTVEGFTNNT